MTDPKDSQAKMSACGDAALGCSAGGAKKEAKPGGSRRNPLKRFDSAMRIQGNQSVFLGYSLAGLAPAFLGLVKFCAGWKIKYVVNSVIIIHYALVHQQATGAGRHLLCRARNAFAQPALVSCRPRATASASGSTVLVMTEPEPT